ncbi:hypothetical protein [Methylocystis sp. SB2]|uniref:hypothetical protein n=1 Tax=Methylocystis sp. (strain SB2) TaxID=743836 RepID=UPI0004A3C919|nr:hypothetical protein [Methylocystis sp. SB2]ULO23098.1 hypothetical protein LNB28_13175 [Methylocystis sp. SB2]
MFNNTLDEKHYAETGSRGEPTAAELKEQVLECVHTLRSSTFGDEEGRESLANILENCDPGHRCGSAACLMCGTAAKRFLVKRVDRLWPEPTPLKSFALISPAFQRALGTLDSISFKSIRTLTRGWLESAGFSDLKAFGFIDLCHSIDRRTGKEEWSPHIHMVTPVEGSEGLTRALKATLESGAQAPIPVRGVTVRDRSRQISYVFKPRPTRTVRYAASSGKAYPTKHWLKREQQVEALLWFGRYKALDRSVTINLGESIRQLKSSRSCASPAHDIGRKRMATQR